jgi:2,4-dienoyl-CoA reductase-like NADH-dependent reductase (Old Yellow Enzyme family)
MPNNSDKSNADIAREIVKKISDAALELAFVRHELTTTDYEATEYPDVEEGVEAFKELVEDVKTDVFAVLTGDETGCLDPEDVDCDNEAEWLRRQLTRAQSQLAKEVLADVGAANIIPHPATDYQQGLVDGIQAVEKRLRALFQRMGIEVEGGE